MNLELERFLENQTEMLGNLTITDSIDVETLTDICEEYHKRKLKLLDIHDVSGMLPDQTKRHIDLAYLTGVFNVSGIDGLQKELTRLKEIGKNPHDIFSHQYFNYFNNVPAKNTRNKEQ